MIESSTYTDSFRTIGRFLDGRQATTIGVEERGQLLRVTWRREGKTAPQERTYERPQLELLCATAREQRHGEAVGLPMSNVEILRVLGSECDQGKMRNLTIREQGENFSVDGMVDQAREHWTYSRKDLFRLILERRARRQEPNAAA